MKSDKSPRKTVKKKLTATGHVLKRSTPQDAGMLRIVCHDNGIGMPPRV